MQYNGEVVSSIDVRMKNGEVVHVSMPSGSTTADLRLVLSSRLGRPSTDFSFSFDGLGTPVFWTNNCHKTQLTLIMDNRVKLQEHVPLIDAGIRPGSAVDAEETTHSLRTLLAPDDFSKGIFVQNLPPSDPQETEDQLVQHFGALGQISRIIVQQDESQHLQHAVVVFRTVEDMHNATATEEHTILGTSVSVRSLEKIEGLTGACIDFHPPLLVFHHSHVCLLISFDLLMRVCV